MIKRWIIAGAVLLMAAFFILPQLAADTHFMLLREIEWLTINPIIGWQMVLSVNQVRQFFMIYLAATALFLIWILVCGSYLKYRSDMQRIAPGIETPCAAGQGQFGTARWMDPKYIGRFFSSWKVGRHKDWFRQLMAAGRDSYKEVEDSDVEVD